MHFLFPCQRCGNHCNIPSISLLAKAINIVNKQNRIARIPSGRTYVHRKVKKKEKNNVLTQRQWLAEGPFLGCIATKHQPGTTPGGGKQSVFPTSNVPDQNNFTDSGHIRMAVISDV